MANTLKMSMIHAIVNMLIIIKYKNIYAKNYELNVKFIIFAL